MKKQILQSALIVALLFTSFCYCQSTIVEKQVLNLSKRKFEWMIHKNLDSLGAMLDDKLKYVHSNGWIQNKQEVIDDINKGKLVMQQIEVTDAEIRMYNRTAIINGKGKFEGLMNDKPFSLNLMYTEVYIQKDKKWLLASRHANKLQ